MCISDSLLSLHRISWCTTFETVFLLNIEACSKIKEFNAWQSLHGIWIYYKWRAQVYCFLFCCCSLPLLYCIWSGCLFAKFQRHPWRWVTIIALLCACVWFGVCLSATLCYLNGKEKHNYIFLICCGLYVYGSVSMHLIWIVSWLYSANHCVCVYVLNVLFVHSLQWCLNCAVHSTITAVTFRISCIISITVSDCKIESINGPRHSLNEYINWTPSEWRG